MVAFVEHIKFLSSCQFFILWKRRPMGSRVRIHYNIKTKRKPLRFPFVVAVWTRLELATPCVTGRYSNQLNYHTVLVFFQRDKGKNIF